jgi:hypothetical protein
LADVHVFSDGGAEERSVDIKLTDFNIACTRNGEEEAETSHANDSGDCFRKVEASALAAAFGDAPGFEAGDITHFVILDVADPHDFDDHAVGGKVDEFPRVVVHEGGVLLMHGGLPFCCLGVGESGPVQFHFATISGGKESNGVKCRARWDVMWTSNEVGHGGLFENVLFGLSMFRVTARRDKNRRVIGHVCHDFPVADLARLEAG